MFSLRLVCLAIVVVACLSCRSLSYPEPESTTAASTGRRSGPIASRSLDDRASEPGDREGLAWNDLTRLARNDVRRGELVLAEERLDQAAAQVASLPPYSASRRAVFGMQARLALDFAKQGEIARADVLADRLFEIAELEPEIGGDSLTALARSVVARRTRADLQGESIFPPEERLRILDIALTTAQAGPIHRDRLQLAFEISQVAEQLGDLELANRAIEQAQADARTLHPGDRSQAASIAVYRARIDLARGELAEAEAAAITANRLFEEIEASEAERGIGEITLALILARQGEVERARLVALAAEARLDAEPPIFNHARRIILGGLARVEVLTGDPAEARRYFRAALDVPAEDFEGDRQLVADLARELNELDAGPIGGASAIGSQSGLPSPE